ncbi:MAG: hypothetical protein OEW87_13465, partial [Flavobacteriaceae bacterium]|nr:hypothetical protein [Flavobacteriaceae bacterium]
LLIISTVSNILLSVLLLKACTQKSGLFRSEREMLAVIENEYVEIVIIDNRNNFLIKTPRFYYVFKLIIMNITEIIW